MGREFVYTQPVKIIFGEGKFALLGSLLEELGVSKCVIACGRHFAPTALQMQEKDSRIAAVFGGVEQNPQLSGAIETARRGRRRRQRHRHRKVCRGDRSRRPGRGGLLPREGALPL